MLNSLLFAFAALAYLGLAFVCWPSRSTCRPTTSNRLLPLIPFAAHIYLLHDGILINGGISLGFASSVSAMMALTVLFYTLSAWFYPLGRLQSFVLALAGLSVALQGLMPQSVPSHSESPVSGLHLLMAFSAYGLFTIAALHAALIALTAKHLHKPVPPKLVAGLPPLLTLENMLFRMIELGFVILTLTLATGFFFADEVYGHAMQFNHMTVFGIASWLIFAALLLGRRLRGWRGKTAIYWTLAGFTSLIFAYVGVKFVLEIILGRV